MIELRSIYKAFDAPVLRGLNLSVAPCTLYGLIGPPAGGKTLLMKILTGLVNADAGRVRIDGQLLRTDNFAALTELRQRMGMQFQNNALFDFMSVEENIAFPLRRLTSLREQEIEERVAERLDSVGLPGFQSRQIVGLSGGQKRRVGIARATVGRPELVIFDDPAAGLDPVTSQKIFELLRADQRRHRTTVIVISCDLDRLLSTVDRVGMLHRGRLIFEGSADEARASDDPAVHQFVHGLTEGPL